MIVLYEKSRPFQVKICIHINDRIVSYFHFVLAIKLSGGGHISRSVICCMVAHIGAKLRTEYFEPFVVKIQIVIQGQHWQRNYILIGAELIYHIVFEREFS